MATAPTIYTSNMGFIAVSVTGVSTDNKSWDYLSGMALTGDNTLYNGGGMQPAIPVSGLRKPGDLTVRRIWNDTTAGFAVALYNAATTAPAQVSYTPMVNQTTSGAKPMVFTGLLGNVTLPEIDSANATILYLEITITPGDSLSQ